MPAQIRFSLSTGVGLGGRGGAGEAQAIAPSETRQSAPKTRSMSQRTMVRERSPPLSVTLKGRPKGL